MPTKGRLFAVHLEGPVLSPEQKQVVVDTAKAATAWGSAGAASAMPADPTIFGLTLTNLAAALAATYSFLLICEWIYRKLFRLRAMRRGWIKGGRSDDGA